MILTDRFFQFEVENKLFDIVDKDGLRPWEAVRYYVICKLFSGDVEEIKIKAKVYTASHIWNCIKSLTVAMFYILCHRNRKFFFMLASRDSDNAVFYDKICDDVFDMVDKADIFAVETVMHSKNYKYKNETCINFLVPIVRRLIWVNFDFGYIVCLLNKSFPTLSVGCKELKSYYRDFLAQYYVYRFLFSYCNTKKVFIVQNGIQKGLFAAAQEKNIDVYEFQHGQISYNHIAYSYPNTTDITGDKIYHPSCLLTFGPFWHTNRYYPGVSNIVIGNSSYTSSEQPPETTGNKKILVISNQGDGELLADLINQIQAIDNSFSFFFKLHPNQYEELSYYRNLFQSKTNVSVVGNNKSINQLLSEVEAVLLVQSTVELEALRSGRKVFVIKSGAYKVMDFVFGEKGVYLIDDATDFVNSYNIHAGEKLDCRHDLFMPFQEKTAKMLLS